MSVDVRLMQPQEADLANAFFNSIYKTNRSQQDFDWEFAQGPFGPAIYVIAVDISATTSTKIVGIQCAIPINLTNASGIKVLTAKSEDTLVDPAYRGQKIFERMYDLLFMECKKAGIQCIWGFTPAKKAFERIGFDIPFQAHQALMVFKPAAAYQYLSKLNVANKLVDKLKISALTAVSWIKPGRSVRPGDITMKKVAIESKEKVLAALHKESEYNYLDMNSAYLRWRLELNPFQNTYENFQFHVGAKLVADVIINYRSSLGYIEQIIFEETLDVSSRRYILLTIIQMMKKNTALLRVLCFDINEELVSQQDLLSRCGFVILNRGAHFVWKSFAGNQIDPNMLFLSRLFTQGNQ